ncbi:MAG: helix-turn-helix domain-containing protein [archaeon]|nr:helix-turn-helix domain-containing protein [archaeon]
MTRQETLVRAMESLKAHSFHVATFFGSNTCFDIIARGPRETLVVKIYENVDSIRKEQGEELKKLGSVLGAKSIIIGERTKVFTLEDGTVYTRYGVDTLNPNTFDAILEDNAPQKKYFKGKNTVGLDFEMLKSKREELNMSMQELAEKIGVATDTLQRFEKGASTSIETAKKIESVLDEKLVKGVDVLHPKIGEMSVDDEPTGEVFEKMHDLGLRMAFFRHSPFKAFGTSEPIFISTAKGAIDIPRKALELRKASAIMDSDSIIVTKEYKYKSAGGVPIIEEDELGTLSKIRDLRKLIKEREEDE